MKKLVKIALIGSLSCLMALPVLADLNDGLVAHYPFDGNANDNSGNGLNGQIHGNAVFTTDRHGDTDNALEFDGTNAYVEVLDDDLLHFESSYTFSLWIKQYGAKSHGYRLIDKETAGTHDGYLLDTYDGQTGHKMRVTSWSNNTQNSNTVYSLNEWHYLAVVFMNGEFKFYLDGVYDGSGENGKQLVNTNTLSLLFGKQHKLDVYPWGGYFFGTMDDIRIYNRALSKSEIQQLYQGENNCTINGGFTQVDIDNAIEQGKQTCINNPASCGITASDSSTSVSGGSTSVIDVRK
jgi:hypothetical protein